MKKVCCVIVIMLSILVFQSGVSAEVFECAFIQEKYSSGKPNRASCSMLPEEVYLTKWHAPKKSEHCKVDAVYSYEDLEDVRIDTEKKTVTWVTSLGLTEDAKPTLKQRYLKEGMSVEEADKRVNVKRRFRETLQIQAHYISQQVIMIDKITQKFLDPPKKVPEHTIIFTHKSNILYYMYIPESSGYAILLEPAGMMDSSWIGMRFGKCRKLR